MSVRLLYERRQCDHHCSDDPPCSFCEHQPARNYPMNDFPFDGWVGVDLDGTLAATTEDMTIGEPIPEMVQRIKRWHAQGIKVKVFTARASSPTEAPKIRAWLLANKLPDLEITNTKDYQMVELWDDKAVEVIKNTGRPANLARRIASATGVC